MRDAQFEFKDVRYAYDDTWPATSKKLTAQGVTRTGKLPALEYKGKILTQVSTGSKYLLLNKPLTFQHVAILRFLSRELGRYDGETSEEKYIVDAVADLYIDWRVSFYFPSQPTRC